MKLFDMHADIGTNLYARMLKGETDVFAKCHLNNLLTGEVKGVFTACWFSGTEDFETMQKMILHCGEVISKRKELQQVLCKEDLDSDKLLVLISVEGMCGIHDGVEEKIEWMYNHGVRVGSLVWNESNDLADGWKHNPLRGLSDLGFRVVKKMNEMGMIIDVSHINELGFWDIITGSTKPVIATHSNIRALCDHQRNLTDQQCKAIALKGGLIGLNAAAGFVHKDKTKQDARHLAKHARYMANLVGVEHIACGFDFMDFLSDYGSGDMASDLSNASMAQNLVKALELEGFSSAEVAAICYGNVERFLKERL